MCADRQSVEYVSFTALSRNVLWDLHEIRLFSTKSKGSLHVFFPEELSFKSFLAASDNCYVYPSATDNYSYVFCYFDGIDIKTLSYFFILFTASG